jgi:succinyl-diaminopimelate desuccinylase
MPDIDLASAPAVALTRDLVRIRSENPTGSEAEIADFVHARLAALPGVESVMQEVQPGRPNVVARLEGDCDLPPLVLIAHMDTVPSGGGWIHGPFAAELIEGRIYGRGACDMKAGLAAAICAFETVARVGRRPRRSFVLCATMDEEGPQMLGVNALVDAGTVDARALVIATEPSDLAVVVAHKGLVWMEVEAFGRLAHAGNPGVGVDAVRAGAEFVVLLNRAVAEISHDHPLLGRTEVTSSAFTGGIKTNVVPDHARMEFDIRVPLPLGIADIHALFERCCREAEASVPGARLTFRQMNNDRPPVEADADGSLARALLESLQRVTGREGRTAVFPAYTDASVVQARTGNPECLVFGPGRLAQAHTADEFVQADQVDQAARVLEDLATRLCLEGRA